MSTAKVKKLHPNTHVSRNLDTQTDLSDKAVTAIAEKINTVLADSFALYLKTKNFHWHMSGSHFRSYHLMLDDHSDEIFATTDPLAERVRKLGAKTLHSIGQIAQVQTITDNDEDFVHPRAMLRELMDDNKKVIKSMREAHKLCDDHEDVATASLLEMYIDAAEKRNWFLFEASRDDDERDHEHRR
ncbi:MAG TPA: DNA starvation/stationary phase protection protein [Xanthobacteraceae bacterium]|nr:DNA starvation/stationary phase protection protein [Xanthobacteraceae bacterium]